MWKTMRLRHVAAALQNAANESLVEVVVAAYLDQARRKDKAYSVSTAVIEVYSQWPKILQDIRQSQVPYDLNLRWMAQRFAEISDIAAINIKTVAVPRNQRQRLTKVIKGKLHDITRLIERPTSGVLVCYDDYLRGKNPAEDDLDIMTYLGQARAGAQRIQRVISILKIPLVGWLLIDAHPALLLICSCMLFCGIYLVATSVCSQSADPSLLHSVMVADSIEAQKIWAKAGTGLWSKVTDTAALLGHVSMIAPLGLALVATLLYPVRRLLQLSGNATTKIESAQNFLFKFAQQLGVKRNALVHIQEANVVKNQVTVDSMASGAVLNLGHMEHVTIHVKENLDASKQAQEIKSLVTELTKKVSEIAPAIPVDAAQGMGADLENLSREMTLAAPRKRWYQHSLTGLQEAAEAVGTLGTPIVELVKLLSPLLLD